MIDYIETSPLPQVCVDCEEEDCYNCDNALERWRLSEKDELLLQKKLKLQAIKRLEYQIEEIDKKLAMI